MVTLGIETSCDETSVAVVERGRVLSNVVSSSVALHTRWGGVVPEIASRCHVEYIIDVLDGALARSGLRLADIGLVAVANGPGLVGALLIGISTAKALSLALDVPLIGVNHIVAHLYSAFLSDDTPEFPFVGLVVSGGHTALFDCRDFDRYRILGQTQDDAVGEAFDKVAKALKLGYPGGPVLEKAAALSKSRNGRLFPRSFLGPDSLDFSFSGVKTAVVYYVRDLERRHAPIDAGTISDIAYSFQEAALDVLAAKALLAARKMKARAIVLGGGVTANKRLREKFAAAEFREGGVTVHFPKFEYCIDNGAMIAGLGERLFRKGHRSDLRLAVEPNLSL